MRFSMVHCCPPGCLMSVLGGRQAIVYTKIESAG
jgi:hypothetical protein